ncbi:hypothetical protein [Terricaulis silvestris]|uniref:Uncharacterized protein n=1 Tax=Terricaulis silvestris TaxID=2686094 RepID=A0A6I6MMD7_9CAUL|nr:hypothetical protein [Terricaulis silvestris]QGZ93887.1 hypothetical protein DSM104635_00701 [Terricaulis silvestris]
MMVMHSMTASLRLVYPPISNQHADWLLEDAAARERLDTAKLYMIAARREVEFHNLAWNEDEQVLSFDLGFPGELVAGSVDVDAIMEDWPRSERGAADVAAGPKRIEISDVNGAGYPVWFTPDKFLWNVWRGHKYVSFAGDVRQFAKYDLLYIGMSQDSAFKRLVALPHEARLKILTNELVRGAQGRLSEEIMFFFFDIDPLFVSTYGDDDEIDDVAVDMLMNPLKRVQPQVLVEDAEKAFIKMLQTPYNRRRYHKYPAIAKGLADTILQRYGYSIAEDLSFMIGDLEMVGGYAEGLPCSNDADFIFVDGPTASLVDISERMRTEFDGAASDEQGPA